jgi:hypothetical protein
VSGTLPLFALAVEGGLFMFVAILQQRIDLLVCDLATAFAATIRRNCALRRLKKMAL